MAYATSTMTSNTPAKDLMAALVTPLTSGGLQLVDSYATPVVGANWQAMAYGNGLFVAMPYGTGTVATSPDGITWTQRSMPVVANWTAVTYGGGQFVAVTNGAVAATSPDGITWTARVLPTTANWAALAYGGGVYVAVSVGTAVALTSPDGITWTQRTLPATIAWYGLAYGNGMFVTTANTSGVTIATSPDGTTWTQRSMPVTGTYRSVTYGGGLFMAVSATSGAVAVSSPDGITWTQRTLPATAVWNAVIYGGSQFVAISNGIIGATSPDGTTWTQRVMVTGTWFTLVYGASIFLATASAGTPSAATSPDGITWTTRTLTGTTETSAADVYKSPAASNQFGQDWYLILRRNADTATQLYYQVCEAYNATTHRASNLGGLGVSTTPVPTTFANPTAASAPDAATGTSAGAAGLVLTTTAFSYWVSTTGNRVVVGVKTSAESGFYAGLYDDLLSAGTTQFPLVCAKFPANQLVGGAIGAGTATQTGGFTREPGQTLASAANFEAVIHNGYTINLGVPSVNFSPLPASTALYANAGAMSRCMIGSMRPVNLTGDALRGLLNGVFCSGIASIAGDTITAGGKTYVRFGGPVATFGFFVDSSL
jgi:hypothetical protein